MVEPRAHNASCIGSSPITPIPVKNTYSNIIYIKIMISVKKKLLVFCLEHN